MEAPGAGADGEGRNLGNGHDGRADGNRQGQRERKKHGGDRPRHHRPRDAPVCLAEEHPGQGLGHAAEGPDRRDREVRKTKSHPHGQRERVHIQALPARPPDPGDTPPPDAGPLPLGEREDREVLRDVQGVRGPRRLPSAEDPGGARRVPPLVRRGQAPPPSRREDPGRGLGRDGPLREASNRSKGSLPLGRAAEGVPVQLQIKYCTPTGMLYAVRFFSVSGSAKTAFFSQYRHPRCRSGVPFLKKDSGRGTPPPSRREDPGRGLGRDGPLREASNRSKGSLPLGRAAEGVPVQLQIKYCTPTGMLYAVRFFSVSGSAKTAFFSQYRHPRCRSGVPFLKKDSGRGTPPPSRREDPGRGLGRDGPLREASNRSKGRLPLGRAAEGVPRQLQIKYCSPDGDAVRSAQYLAARKQECSISAMKKPLSWGRRKGFSQKGQRTGQRGNGATKTTYILRCRWNHELIL